MVPAYLRVTGPNGPPLLPPRGQKSAVGYLAKRRIGQKKGGGAGLDPLKSFSLKVNISGGGKGEVLFVIKLLSVNDAYRLKEVHFVYVIQLWPWVVGAYFISKS